MKNDEAIALLITIITLIMSVVFFTVAINPDRHESDPAVYERYVEDMRKAGRKPNGEPLEPDAFKDSIWWIEGDK